MKRSLYIGVVLSLFSTFLVSHEEKKAVVADRENSILIEERVASQDDKETDDSLLTQLYRNPGFDDESEKEVTYISRLDHAVRGLGYTLCFTMSGLVSSLLVVSTYYLLISESQVKRIHWLYDDQRMEKSGPEWEKELAKAQAIRFNKQGLIPFLNTLAVGALVYSNWKAQTPKKAWLHFKKTIE